MSENLSSEMVTINSENCKSREDIIRALNPLVSNSVKNYSNPNDTSSWKDEMLKDEDNFRNGKETEIPEMVIKYMQWVVDNNLEVQVYRKYITNSCTAAVEARNLILGDKLDKPLDNENEPKTLVYTLYEDNPNYTEGKTPKLLATTEVAIVIEADDELIANKENKFDKEQFLQLINEVYGKDFKKMELSPARTHGRQEPVVFSMLEGDVIDDKSGNKLEKIMLVDHSLTEPKTRCNNAGNGTWGILIKDMCPYFEVMKQKMGEDLNFFAHGIKAEQKPNSQVISTTFTTKMIADLSHVSHL